MTDQAASLGTPEPPHLRLRTPTDVLEAIPYLLGFRPTRSLVGLLLDAEDSSVDVVARYDLPGPDAVGDLGRDLVARAAAHAAGQIVVVVFADEHEHADSGSLRAVFQQVLATLRHAGLDVVDALHVSGGRYRSYLCSGPVCCPAEGRPFPAPGSGRSEVATAAARAGLVVLPSRAAVAEALEPATGAARDDMERALGEAEAGFIEAAAARGLRAWRAGASRALRHAIGRTPASGPESLATSGLDDRAVAEMLVALSDTAVRDDCWLAVEQAAPGRGMGLWRELVRRAVPPYDVAPLFLLGWAAWRGGDGALARLAAERALSSDADYRAARLLLDAVDSGLDPRWLPALSTRWHSLRHRAGGPT